jgi:hypothetical protein
MGNLVVNKPGKSKAQLMECLENLKVKFKDQMHSNDVTLEKTSDGYNITGEKKILFMTFWVKSQIKAMDEKFELEWETNAPEGRVEDAMREVTKVLDDC